MTSDKKHAPDSLKYQWRLLGSVTRSGWATSLDKSIAFEIIDNYRKERGDSRASLRYLEKATGAARPNVIASVRRLCENGPFSVALQGGGTRPTAYALHFDKVAEKPSGNAGNTTSDAVPSGNAGNTTVVSRAIPLDEASGIVGNTKSVLQVDGLQADLLDRMIDPAAPLAPPLADGLGATAAGGTAVEVRPDTPADTWPTFEALWRAYAHAKGKKEARAAWDALPAEVDRAAVIEAAKAWQASWAAQGKPDAPRFALARWLKDERYDEDAPTGYVKTEKASKPKPQPAGKPTPAAKSPEPPIVARISTAEVVTEGSTTELRFTATNEAGVEHERVIVLEHTDMETQFEGQRQLAKLVHAAGLEQINDSGELHGRTIVMTETGFTAPITRPDNDTPLPVKPEPEPLPVPESKPWTEADEAALKARIEAIAPRRGPTEWERKKAAQWRREAGRREWDKAHPEFFDTSAGEEEMTWAQAIKMTGHADDALPPQPSDWPAWMDAEYEEDDEAA
ncbi:hypothetical protein [Bradyrhizobium sp. CCGB20]|uniref:hypothetical protein n=1 Tax=Bradyrhizobium sp. CCGB20 TaxID=2949633 RepID=UPI0020B332CB|nr:hypothetical protein [Bradyrhizobium sp. CCGB20]MCP3400245.1 hypothetical protein [Bradyrhizobium sp. CCGB20]